MGRIEITIYHFRPVGSLSNATSPLIFGRKLVRDELENGFGWDGNFLSVEFNLAMLYDSKIRLLSVENPINRLRRPVGRTAGRT